MSWTIALSGPEKTRAKAEVALEDARVPIYPENHHAPMDWARKFPEDTDAWLTVEHADVNAAVRAIENVKGWRLRVHYPTPDAPAPQGPNVFAELAELKARLAALEAGTGLPPIGGGSLESPPWATQTGAFGAEQTRRALMGWLSRTSANTPGIVNGGLAAAGDLALTAPGSGLSVLVGTGEAYVGGGEGPVQGAYYARSASSNSLAISAASPSNPRVDTLALTVSDAGYTEPVGGSGSQVALQVVTGLPTATASLANLLGVATLPLSSLLLGYVLVPTSATNVITADIATVAAVAQPGVTGIVVGAVMQYGGPSDPSPQWMVCDGRAISRSTYATLFGVAGTTYGSGNGSTTFNIPDLRGRVAVGADPTGVHLPVNEPALGAIGGEEQHTLATTEMPSHSHTTNYDGNEFYYVGGAGPFANPGGGTAMNHGSSGFAVNNNGGGSAHNNLQPYLAVNHIIKVL